MRIVHCAPFNIVTKIGGALYSNPVKISQGLIENGHFVHNFDYRDHARHYSLFNNKSGGAKKMNQLFKECIHAISPDLVIFGHAELIEETTFHYLKQKNIKMILWYNDMVIENHLKNLGYLFDLILITGAGLILEKIKHFNSNAFFLPNPVNKNMERAKAFTQQQQPYDLLFSGRKDLQRHEFINLIKKHLSAKISVNIIGDTRESTIIGDPYFELIYNTKICLNHSRDAYMINQWYTSDRLMHILGNGSFCLSRSIIHGEDFFEDKLEYYDNFDEMQNKTLYFIENEQARIEKAQWLYHRVHQIFNTKRIGAYILELLNQDFKKLKQYEWWK